MSFRRSLWEASWQWRWFLSDWQIAEVWQGDGCRSWSGGGGRSGRFFWTIASTAVRPLFSLTSKHSPGCSCSSPFPALAGPSLLSGPSVFTLFAQCSWAWGAVPAGRTVWQNWRPLTLFNKFTPVKLSTQAFPPGTAPCGTFKLLHKRSPVLRGTGQIGVYVTCFSRWCATWIQPKLSGWGGWISCWWYWKAEPSFLLSSLRFII